MDQTVDKLIVGMLIFKGMTQLDFTAPYEIFARMDNAKVYVLAKDSSPVETELGLAILPSQEYNISNCPQVDIIFVPGGPGIVNPVQDNDYYEFLTRQAPKAKYITSVCTGAFVLASAGLLKGYEATTHWASIDILKMFGAKPMKDKRVVKDGNRITAGGVTSGLDFGFEILTILRGEEKAQEVQLLMQYDPHLLYPGAGFPSTASPAIVKRLTSKLEPSLEERKEVFRKIIEERHLND